ncbi:hypothetical protein ACFX13_042352 [Malus domestica]
MPFPITEETASSDQKPVFSENVFLPPTSLNPSQVVAVVEAGAVSLIYAAELESKSKTGAWKIISTFPSPDWTQKSRLKGRRFGISESLFRSARAGACSDAPSPRGARGRGV